MGKVQPVWKNRIVGYGEEAPDQLLASPWNWRIHPKPQQDALSGVLRSVGLVQNVIVNKRASPDWPDGQRGVETVVDGHLRISLAISEGQPTVPITYVDLGPEEEALVLATLDPLGAMAVADKDQLAALLDEVRVGDAAVQAMLAELADKNGLDWGKSEVTEDPGPQIDRAEELREKWGTGLGQLWEIPSKTVPGKAHRLLCGDSTDECALHELLDAQSATMCFSGPAWDVAIGQDLNPRHRQRPGLQNDNLTGGEFEAFLMAFARAIIQVVKGDLYCVLGASEWPRLDSCLRRVGWHWSATIIWVKDFFVLGRSNYHRRYEPLWYGWASGSVSSFQGQRGLDDVWDIRRPRTSEEHPTMKPVELVQRAIQNSSRQGGNVLDPFLGSGTTMVAAEQLGRIAYGCDIEPRYIAVTLERMAGMGLEPRLCTAS